MVTGTQSMSSDVIYRLNDKPPAGALILAAVQHVLASFIGIITPTIVIHFAIGGSFAGSFGFGDYFTYLISMSLIISGIATIIQARGQTFRGLQVGSGLLSLQGTSFAFVSAIIASFIGLAAGGAVSIEAAMSIVFIVIMLASFVEIGLSFALDKLKKVITPIVTGVVILSIGISLIAVSIRDIGGGAPLAFSGDAAFGSLDKLFIGGVVLITVLVVNFAFKNPLIRLASIIIGMGVGFVVAILLGEVNWSNYSAPDQWFEWIALPIPLWFTLQGGFSGITFGAFLGVLLPIAFIFVVTAIESVGDLTATSRFSDEPVEGPVYLKRIRGGVFGDGINSFIAGLFNTFPNTTFSQNNAVIQMTGVGSRYVGMAAGAIFIVLGLFPAVYEVLRLLPPPVVGGATLVLFGTVAAAGIRIISSVDLGRREMTIIAVSLGLGIGVAFVPSIVSHVPNWEYLPLRTILSSAITVAGISAIVLSLALPKNKSSHDA